MMKNYWKIGIFLGLVSGSGLALAVDESRPNVLFIAVDDLRSQLGCYGYEDMVTPNIDSLAADGVLFEHHYVSHPICIPSRAALLTSLRSERTQQVYGPAKWVDVEGVQTVGRTFGDAGYSTASFGKVWHTTGRVDPELADRFDVVWKRSDDSIYADPELSKLRQELDYSDREGVRRIKAQLPAAEGPFDVPDEAYGDGQMVGEVMQFIENSVEAGEPFLAIVGFQKPHLPFNAPKKYWDLYDPQNPPGTPRLEELPEGGSKYEIRTNHELWRYAEGFRLNKPPSGEAANRLRHAYAACISFVDAQIGKILAEVDRLGIRDNTIIVFWSDHGFQLGHLGSWTKGTNLEMTAGSPLIISAPNFAEGAKTTRVVESVDLFPTLVDLCGLAPLEITDGKSLRPLLEEPMSEEWTYPGYHLVRRGGPPLGRAVRDERFRYVEWRKSWERDSKIMDVELYDYLKHPEERINVADNPEYAKERERLAKLLWEWDAKAKASSSL
ncbi:MAG: sulfatase [Verrucomicrobiota bacterium]